MAANFLQTSSPEREDLELIEKKGCFIGVKSVVSVPIPNLL